MSNAVALKQDSLPAKLEQVLISGDLAKLSSEERVIYYNRVCETVGLNPLTKPFDYIMLNGKLVLYANKGCGEQLRSSHAISIRITHRQTIEGVYVVTAAAQGADGRVDESTGAVQIAGLKGDVLANAMMKAETKAKRRVTLSICGLNMLDDTEVETIAPPKIFADQPGPNDGVRPKEKVTVFQNGSHARKDITELPLPELRKTIERMESTEGLSTEELATLDRAKAYLEVAEQVEPAEEPPTSEKPICACGSGLVLSERKGVYYCPNFKDASFQHIRTIPKAKYEAM